MTDWNLPPGEIEARSFAIIDAEAGEHGFGPEAWSIVRRMIHTSGDFDYIKNVRIHEKAIKRGVAAIKSGAAVFTDTNMARAGISRARLKPFGCEVKCLMAEPAIAKTAKAEGLTRAVTAVDAALPGLDGAIYVVGNAPTALFRLLEHINEGRADPALVVGVPVGFVNAAESKQALYESGAVHIAALGRKGGSNLAASIINALAVLAEKEQ